MALFKNGRAEVVFEDGTAVVFHAPNAERASYFHSDGRRVRVLTSCVPANFSDSSHVQKDKPQASHSPATTSDPIRMKIASAISLRTRFSPYEVRVQPIESLHLSDIQWYYAKFTHVRWPASKNLIPGFVSICEKGIVSVTSLDGKASLFLAAHAKTYTVKWWCPVECECAIDGAFNKNTSPIEAEHHDRNGLLGIEDAALPRRRLFDSPNGNAGVQMRYAHVLLTQHLVVAEEPPLAWVQPLRLALELKREHHSSANVCTQSTDLGATIEFLARTLHQHRECDNLAVTTTELIVALPLKQAIVPPVPVHSWSRDDSSPAVKLGGVGGDGALRVLWSPDAVTWLYEDRSSKGGSEATIDLSGSVCNVNVSAASALSASSTTDAACEAVGVLVSSQCGRFWQCFGAQGESLDVFCTAVLPLDSDFARRSALATEASQWLRRNQAEGVGFDSASATTCADAAVDLDIRRAGGWILMKEFIKDDVGRLSIFCQANVGTAIGRYLVRVFFSDTARLEWIACEDEARRGWPRLPAPSDTFRLLCTRGEAIQRTFGLPVGCEGYARGATMLLHSAGTDLEKVRLSALAGADLTLAARHRAMALLLRHGECSLADALGSHVRPTWAQLSPSQLPSGSDVDDLAAGSTCSQAPVMSPQGCDVQVALERIRLAQLGIEQILVRDDAADAALTAMTDC
eukprot:TRINITY_DN6506_c0_g2_i3.p1 TRINITY_DN6506_c0_g2~~TRINITY_DN6506_c0_g2_i3.p1  ORF type:complete len:761 (+),score=81.29 TRINITY_DN6506_c0_g2_i3:221-2284(+)